MFVATAPLLLPLPEFDPRPSHAGFMVDEVVLGRVCINDPEDEGSRFIRNLFNDLPDYTLS
jgi:hypothetical protein